MTRTMEEIEIGYYRRTKELEASFQINIEKSREIDELRAKVKELKNLIYNLPYWTWEDIGMTKEEFEKEFKPEQRNNL